MNRPAPRFLALVTLALALALIATPLASFADEDPPVPGPRDLPPDEPVPEKPAAEPKAPPKPEAPAFRFDPKDFELLPINEVDRIKLQRAHPGLVYRLQLLSKRSDKIANQLAKRKDKRDDGSKKLRTELERVRGQMTKAMVKAVDAMREYGVDERVLALVDAMPKGGPYRVERYAHTLVLEVADLTDAQRALFERVVPEVNGAYFSLNAERKRLNLFAKQAELDQDRTRQLTNTIDRQLRQMDKRFWQLVDYTLAEPQRVELKNLLPSKMQKVANPIEHLYALPGLTASQGTRLKSILTEMEAEMAPDQALVKRNQTLMRGSDEKNNAALKKENQEAYARLQDLQLYAAETMKAVLTEPQYQAYLAIPPNISNNERKQRAKKLLEGVPFTGEQEQAYKQLEREYRQKGRAIQERVRTIRRKGSDYGPDSPQMGMMQMEMAGAAAEGQVLQREAMGRMFMEVLDHDQISGWVLGFYGPMR